jgi:ribonuclease inhibitor
VSKPRTRRSTIDGRTRTKVGVMAKLARDLKFPEHFGGNLDALYDVLRTDLPGPISITWTGGRKALGKDFDGLARVLRDVAAERGDVMVTIED